MKSKDFALLAVFIGLAGLASFFLSNLLFSNQKALTTKVEVVQPITSDFSYENKSYFKVDPANPSKNPLNPTKDITVTANNNQKPLSQ